MIPHSNPFYHLKVRYVALAAVLYSLFFIVGLKVYTAWSQPMAFTDDMFFLTKAWFTGGIAIILLVWSFRKLSPHGIRIIDSFKPRGTPSQMIKDMSIGIPGFLFGSSALLIIYGLILQVFPSFTLFQVQAPIYKFANASWLTQILFILLFVGVIPVVEEFFFRGVLINRWSMRWDTTTAVILSSVFFAVLHGDNFVGALVIGLVNALIYVKRGSLLVPILIHMVVNSISTYFNYLDPSQLQAVSMAQTLDIALIVFYLSLIWLIIFIYKNWPTRHSQSLYGYLFDR